MTLRTFTLLSFTVIFIAFTTLLSTHSSRAYTDVPPNGSYDRTGSGGTPDYGSATVTNGGDDIDFSGDYDDTLSLMYLGSAYDSANYGTDYYEFTEIQGTGCHPNCFSYVRKNLSEQVVATGEIHDHTVCPPFGG